MAGFRLNDGSSGCPTTATPPAGYTSPFRFDSAGRLWITSCFKNFQYFGEARQDLLAPAAISSVAYDGDPTNYITQGRIITRTVTNTTQCTIGILLAHDMLVDLQTREDNFVYVTLNEIWNGAVHSVATCSSQFKSGSTDYVRTYLHNGAVPHDVNAVTGGSTLQIAPGASATVGCRFHVDYAIGSNQASDYLYGLNGAVRIYGYTLS